MDELIQSCLREIAFDGDYGCDAKRLKTFISNFYDQGKRSGSVASQNVDDDFRALVWAFIIQQPSVRVGFLPKDAKESVYVAPNVKKARDAGEKREKYLKNKRKDAAATEESQPTLECLSREEITTTSLDELLSRYGGKLRIAVDPETCFVAVTGSHLRPSKLTPMVYTTLQIIARAREDGIPFVHIDKITDYSAGTVFYLVKQLESLGLVKKFTRVHKNGRQVAVHKHFYDSNAKWQAIQDEERTAEKGKSTPGGGQPQDPGLSDDEDDAEDDENLGNNDEEDDGSPISFGPIDATHLSSSPLIIARLMKLLEHSKNHTHRQENILVRIGFAKPRKPERRHFSKIINDAVAQGIIEKVDLPSIIGKSRTSVARCLRLVPEDERNARRLANEAQRDAHEEEEQNKEDPTEAASSGTRFLATVSLQRQLVALLEQAGMEGLTHHDFIARLGSCEKRMIEHQLEKLSKAPPPPHLADFGFLSVMDSFGRERRLRYYNTRSFELLKEREGHLKKEEAVKDDEDRVGGFGAYQDSDFYADETQLGNFIDTYVPKRYGVTPRTPKFSTNPNRRNKNVNPIGPDGRPKKGRPRKEWTGGTPSRKRKRETVEAGDGDGAPPKSAKRPRKKKEPVEEGDGDAAAPKPAKRPRKKKVDVTEAQKEANDVPTENVEGAVVAATEPVKKTPAKKGRPRKAAKEEKAQEAEAVPGVEVPADQEPQAATDTPKGKRKRQVDSSTNVSQPPSKRKRTESSKASKAQEVVKDSTQSDVQAPPPADNEVPAVLPEGPNKDPPPVPGPSTAVSLIHDAERGLPPIVPPPDSNGPVAASAIESTEVKEVKPRGVAAASSARQMRPNLSYARRAVEVLDTLKKAGGILYTGHALLKAHQAHVEELVASGVRASSSGSAMDKKTLENVLDYLVRDNEVKVLTTSTRALGQSLRAVRLAYLIDTPPEDIERYRRSLEKKFNIVSLKAATKIDVPMAYSDPGRRADRPADKSMVRSAAKGPEGQTRGSKPEEMTMEDLRDYILEMEPRTVAQLYGYIMGLFWRARELHLYTLQEITGSNPSQFVVSVPERIVEVEYFFKGLPVGTWCAIVPVIRYHPELEAFLHLPEGRDTPLISAPQEVFNACRPTYFRARQKLYHLLEVLTALRIISPLQACTEEPDVTCQPNAGLPTAFKLVELTTVRDVPLYWRFNTRIPVYDFQSTPANLLGVATVADVDASFQCWDVLDGLSKGTSLEAISSALLVNDEADPFPEVSKGNLDALASFARDAAWDREYKLSAYQKQCLRRYVDPQTGDTPLQGEDAAEWLHAISCALASPENAVYDYLDDLRDKTQQYLARSRIKQARARKLMQIFDPKEGARVLASKAAEAKQQMERQWQELVQQTTASLLPGSFSLNTPQLQEVKKRWWTRGGLMNVDHARDQIIAATTGTALPLVKKLERRFVPMRQARVSEAVAGATDGSTSAVDDSPHCSTCEKELDIIASLVSHLSTREPLEPKKRRKRETTNEQTDAVDDRGKAKRFVWTPEYDELALDADAVFRCRGDPDLKITDTSALEKVFPGVRSSGIRGRLNKIRAERPGGVAYSQQLTAAWDILRRQPHGDVVDPYPDSLTHFPIERHIAYLRAHIDKSKLTMPSSDAVGDGRAGPTATLPLDVSILRSQWEIIDPIVDDWPWDMIWNLSTDEMRERNLHHEAFTVATASVSIGEDEADRTAKRLAEAAVKMTISPGEELYDEKAASEMLQLIGEDRVQVAFSALSGQGILVRLGGERRPKPGRPYAISETQHAALEGQISWRLYRDAELMERDLLRDDLSTWPLMATDGNVAALLDLVSRDQVEIDIDTSTCTVKNFGVDYNSRKIGDEHLENTVTVSRKRKRASSYEPLAAASLPMASAVANRVREAIDQDGAIHDGLGTACANHTQGPVNCTACIQGAFSRYLLGLDDNVNRKFASRLQEFVSGSGKLGISISQLRAFCSAAALPFEHVRGLVGDLTRTDVPVFGIVGYDASRLISAEYLRSWSIPLTSEPFTMTYPRRWLNASGQRSDDIWQSALRSVMSWILVRPGISEVHLRKRAANILDRPEMNDVLQFLLVGRFAKRVTPSISSTGEVVGLIDEQEELQSYWLAGEEPWYHIH